MRRLRPPTDVFVRDTPQDVPPITVMLGCSAAATFNAQLVSYPLYCIKANMQSSNTDEGVVATARRMYVRGVRCGGVWSGAGLGRALLPSSVLRSVSGCVRL